MHRKLNPDASPVFITGVYRSGTTVLSRMLDAHSKLSVTFDSVHFLRFCYDALVADPTVENALAQVEDMRRRCEIRWERPIDLKVVEDAVRSSPHVDPARIYNHVMTELLLTAGKQRWGEKTLIAWSKIPAFLEMFPRGKAIQVIRDPRDVTASNQRITYEPGLRYLDAAFACLSSMCAAAKYEISLPKGFYATVRYEDLVADAEGTMRRLCGMLEVDFEPGMIDARNFKGYNGELWKRNTSYSELSSVLDAGSVGRYRGRLSHVDIYFLEMINRPVMGDFGYAYEARALDRDEWAKLYEILQDEFISGRYMHWLKTGEGVEAYPSAPPRTLRMGPADITSEVES